MSLAEEGVGPMKREDAIRTIIDTIEGRDLLVLTTGLISREVFERYDADRNFYMPGSMGLASSIGCGLALARPSRRVVVIDGDASLLMNLGSLATIGFQRPNNLLHIVLDNGAYGSCSEEPSMSSSAHLNRLAQTTGYARVRVASKPSHIIRAILDPNPGPSFILCKIKLGGRRDFLRPMQLAAITHKFMNYIDLTEGASS
jgi:phosphonopyruvate decarboxylase